jgi:hypothetical protein
VPVLTMSVVSLFWTDRPVSSADYAIVETWWPNDVDPIPAETSFGASSVSLLADTISWSSSALTLPNIALTSIVEWWNHDIGNFGLELPGETSSSTEFVHLLAVGIFSLSLADLRITFADRTIVNRSDDDVDEFP